MTQTQTQVQDTLPTLTVLFKAYKKNMEKQGVTIRPRDFKKILLLQPGETLDKKKKDFCLSHIFALFQ